jgi:hypothetical protein
MGGSFILKWLLVVRFLLALMHFRKREKAKPAVRSLPAILTSTTLDKVS